MFRLIFNLALRNVIRHRERSLLTLIGVLLAVGSYVALVSLAEGLAIRLNEEVSHRRVDYYLLPSSSGTYQASGLGLGQGGIQTVDPKVLLEIEGWGGMGRAVGIYRGSVQAGEKSYPYLSIDTLNPGDFLPTLVFSQGVKEGFVLKGKSVHLKQDHLEVGVESLKVEGMVQGGGFIDDGFYLAPEDAKELSSGGGFDELWLQVDGTADPNLMRDWLEESYGDSYIILSSDEMMQTTQNYSRLVWLVQFSIASIGVLIAMTASMNTMLMSTYERLRELATLRAIGAGRWQVVGILLCESVILNVIGGLLGCLFGILCSFVLDKAVVMLLGLSSALAKITFGLVFSALALSVLIGFVGALIPSSIAWKLDIVKNLRSD